MADAYSGENGGSRIPCVQKRMIAKTFKKTFRKIDHQSKIYRDFYDIFVALILTNNLIEFEMIKQTLC